MKDNELTFVKTQPRSLYGVNVSGGTDRSRYFMSGEVDDEHGPDRDAGVRDRAVQRRGHVPVRKEWLHPEAATKMNFRGNLSAAISPTLDLNFNSGFARNENRLPPSGSSLEALYYVGMQNYGYKGCPGGVASVRSRQDPDRRSTPVAAQRVLPVRAGRRHAASSVRRSSSGRR